MYHKIEREKKRKKWGKSDRCDKKTKLGENQIKKKVDVCLGSKIPHEKKERARKE